jgi:hypothetical protein
MTAQLRNLPVPHAQCRANGIGQHQHRLVEIAIDPVGNARAVGCREVGKIVHEVLAKETPRRAAPVATRRHSAGSWDRVWTRSGSDKITKFDHSLSGKMT